jgi:hypothetical protein
LTLRERGGQPQSTERFATRYEGMATPLRGWPSWLDEPAFRRRQAPGELVRHEQDPNVSFWQMLKTGSDAFVETGQPPMVAVCDQRYLFNSLAMNTDLDPSGPCPPDINVTADLPTIRAASIGVRNWCPRPAVGRLSRPICSKNKRNPSRTLMATQSCVVLA